MNYDLSEKTERKKFIKRANYLLRKERNNVQLLNESSRTLEQNSYIHVLCRIMAMDTYVSERYAKYVYFKQLANPDIFFSTTKDKLTGKTISYIRSCADLNITETSKAIDNFLIWAAKQGYELPAATLDNDGNLTFNSDKDRQMFHKAQIATSKLDEQEITV